MPGKRKPFKSPPKRFQPRGLSVIYEDHDILVVNKANGILTVSTANSRENTAYFLLTNYVRKGDPKSRKRLFIVHRLDRDTSGVIVFAKTEPAKRFLQDNWSSFQKTYVSVVHGKLVKAEGLIQSYLAENRAFNMYSTTDPSRGKWSETGYRVLQETDLFSILEIDLLTGRKNQIRVHLADEGHPVVGDTVYGSPGKHFKRLCLHATALTILHPYSRESMTFESQVPSYFRSLVARK